MVSGSLFHLQASLEPCSDTKRGPHSSAGNPCLPLNSLLVLSHLRVSHQAHSPAKGPHTLLQAALTRPLAWEALPFPVRKGLEAESLNNLLRDPQLVSGEVSIWFQGDVPPASSIHDQESPGEVAGAEEKGFCGETSTSLQDLGLRASERAQSTVPWFRTWSQLPLPASCGVQDGACPTPHTVAHGTPCFPGILYLRCSNYQV